MLASNFTEIINYNTHKNNNNNEQLSAFTPTAVTATSTPSSSSSSSLDYLYQAITLIEETKNNTLEPNTKKQDGEQFTAQYLKQCTNPCCNCKSSKKRKETLPLRVSKQHRQDRKAERQNLSKYKKIKTYNSNYTDNKPSAGQFVVNRLEKAKILARKSELRLNISSDPLTPVSSSSLSPQSVKSSISPTISPFLNQSNQSTSAFNYYPIEILPNMLPFYYTPFNQSAQVPQPPPVQTAPLNNDPNYLHNLISTIYSLANYQQMQHLHNPLPQTPLLNNNNLILYSIQQQLQHQQQQQQRITLPSPIQQQVQAPKTTEPIVKSKLISYINESDIENKVNEHFRRSLGSKYIKISHKLTRTICKTLFKPKKRPYRDENNNDYHNDDNDLEVSLEQENKSENNDLNTSGINYDDYDETFIEYSNDGELERQPLSPVSTVSADSYSSQAMLNDLITQNELNEDDDTCLTPAATNNTLLYSPVSSYSAIDNI